MNKQLTYKELLTANEQLRQRVEWLEGVYSSNRDEGVHVKTRFLANLTHEIRTPMNAILGFSDLLKTENLTDSDKDEYIQYISHNSHSLLKVLDNIIDLSLLEGSSIKLRKDEILISELLSEIYEYYNSRVSRSMQYRVALLLTVPTQYERITILADGRKLRRMIENLISSAITFQKKGVIELKLDIVEDKIVRITIITEESKLLEDRAKMIFENNEKQDDWYNQIDMTGLSFKLANDLTKEMGGSVGLVQGVLKRFGICIELPLNGFEKKPNTISEKRENPLVNERF